MNNILTVKNLKKTFKQGGQTLKVLEDANLDIKKGDNIALVGPSGCGKSTFLQIIALLDKADSGEIIFNGKNIAKKSDQQKTKIRKNHIGFIYQFHHLLPEFDAIENVMLPLFIQGKKQVQAREKAKEILTNLGLGNRLHHKPAELSGGEQQRVAIARGLVHDPEILLADEPTGNLDPKNSQKMFDLFLKEIKSRKQTTLIVTHDLNLAKKLDKIITIENGHIKNFK